MKFTQIPRLALAALVLTLSGCGRTSAAESITPQSDGSSFSNQEIPFQPNQDLPQIQTTAPTVSTFQTPTTPAVTNPPTTPLPPETFEPPIAGIKIRSLNTVFDPQQPASPTVEQTPQTFPATQNTPSTTTTQPATQQAIQDSGKKHTVKKGETISEIAGAYGVKSANLSAINQLSDRNYIKPGQSLIIPTS